MSWPLAAAWVLVAGSLFLTFGTGAQAWANVTEYRDLLRVAPPSAQDALMAALKGPVLTDFFGYLSARLSGGAGIIATIKFVWQLYRALFTAAFVIPRRMTAIRRSGPEEAARLAQLLRLPAVWSIILAGSALVLVSAVIQLVLGYTA